MERTARRVILPHTTKGYNMKKTTKAVNKATKRVVTKKVTVTSHMPLSTIRSIARKATQIEDATRASNLNTQNTREGQYAQIARDLTAMLAEGRNTAANTEWNYRRDNYAITCGFNVLDKDAEKQTAQRKLFNRSGQYAGLLDALKKASFNIPTRERDESDIALAERNKASKQRDINRIKAEVKKQQPKIAPEMLQAKAEKLYADKKEAATESGKQKKECAKVIVWLEALAKRVKAQELGDADPKPCLERIAALSISINELA